MLEQIDVTSKEGQAYVQAESDAKRRFGRHLVRDVRNVTRSSDPPEKKSKLYSNSSTGLIKQNNESKHKIH